tara:strand:- start:25 stop:408 length:384 start_codon:yes stop_codon:yes gene_type:complete
MKKNRYIEYAKKIAKKSDYGKFKHGAVLVKGSSVRNISCNKHRHCSFGARFRKADRGAATLHAELGAILGMDRTTTTGATVYVARINKEGKARNSKPCPMCQSAMEHVGIRRVVYTDADGDVVSMKL